MHFPLLGSCSRPRCGPHLSGPVNNEGCLLFTPNRTLRRSLGPEPQLPGTGRPPAPLTGSGRLPLTRPLSWPLWDKTDGPPVRLMLSQGCRWDVRQEPPPPLWAGAWHPAHCGLQLTVWPSIQPYHHIWDSGPFCTNKLPPYLPQGVSQSPWCGSEVTVIVRARSTGHPLNSAPIWCRKRVSPLLSRGGNQIPEAGLPAGPQSFLHGCTGNRAETSPLGPTLLLTEDFGGQMQGPEKVALGF